MQIYSIPLLGLDLTHSVGNREGRGGRGGVVSHCGSDQAACILKIDSRHLFFRSHCPLRATLITGLMSLWDAGINLTRCEDTLTWRSWESDLLYHCGCVSEIKRPFSRLYQDSIAVTVTDHTSLLAAGRASRSDCTSLHHQALLSFSSYLFMMMAALPQVTPLFYVPKADGGTRLLLYDHSSRSCSRL